MLQDLAAVDHIVDLLGHNVGIRKMSNAFTTLGKCTSVAEQFTAPMASDFI
jgi:hypothetical protein